MATQTKTKVDRRRREIAASYRKQGYRVTMPSAPESMPPFLHDCHPDLIAEKEGDRVVIEVKPANALKGANDLIELADRVAAQPGWRLELVTVRAEPDYTQFLTSDWANAMLRPPPPGTDMARECVYRSEVLACLVRGIASANNIRTGDKTILHIARELVYRGLLDQDLLERVEDAIAWQDHMMRRIPVSLPADRQAAELETLCRDILTHAQHPED